MIKLLQGVFILMLLFLGCASSQAQDDPFAYHSLFGSDGTNESGISLNERNARVYTDLWMQYSEAHQRIDWPLEKVMPTAAQASPATQTRFSNMTKMIYYGELLEAMAELRAFTTQNLGCIKAGDKDELIRIDHVLRALNLRYMIPVSEQSTNQGMIDFCRTMGIDKVHEKLKPVLFNDDGAQGPVPTIKFIMLHDGWTG